MNANSYTIKSQEALQRAQLLAQELGHQQIENEHILKGIFEIDENVTPFLLKKMKCIFQNYLLGLMTQVWLH